MSETEIKDSIKKSLDKGTADWMRIDKPVGKTVHESGYLKCPDCGTFIPICSSTAEVLCKCGWKAKFSRVKHERA